MLECIFTVDYEIFGDGQGDIGELVCAPTERLAAIFARHGASLVIFLEALEFEQIERQRSDPRVADVRRQMRALHRAGHEIGLHIHPQWANARFADGRWQLDFSEYSLCRLAPDRMAEIVDRAIAYTRQAVGDSTYTPKSFRAGAWLFQPGAELAKILHAREIRVDSSVYKGGLHTRRGLDYRRTLKNPRYWRFTSEVSEPVPSGALLELPVHTRMVAPWRLLSERRIELQRRRVAATGARWGLFERWRDLLRLRQPLKFDFNRMSFAELCDVVSRALAEDRQRPELPWPLVAIAHTKDSFDFDAIDRFLGWLRAQNIPISTLRSAAERCLEAAPALELEACACSG